MSRRKAMTTWEEIKKYFAKNSYAEVEGGIDSYSDMVKKTYEVLSEAHFREVYNLYLRKISNSKCDIFHLTLENYKAKPWISIAFGIPLCISINLTDVLTDADISVINDNATKISFINESKDNFDKNKDKLLNLDMRKYTDDSVYAYIVLFFKHAPEIDILDIKHIDNIPLKDYSRFEQKYLAILFYKRAFSVTNYSYIKDNNSFPLQYCNFHRLRLQHHDVTMKKRELFPNIQYD